MLVPSLLLAAASHDLYTLSLHDALPILKALDTARSVVVGTFGSDQALVVCVGAGGRSVECGLGGYDGQGDPCDPPCRRHRDGSADGRRGGSDGRRKSSLGSSGGRGGSGIGDGRRSAG